MTTPTLELNQEGFTRASGYQCTQWITQGLETNPDSNAGLFVIRNVLDVEYLDHIAIPSDFVMYELNELKYFEAKSTTPSDTSGLQILNTLAGDILTIAQYPDTWLQAETPYTDATFIVVDVEDSPVLTGAGLPTLSPPNFLSIENYTFTDDDIGRWFFVVSGITTTPYRVVSQGGSIANVDQLITTQYIGDAVYVKRVLININVGGEAGPRYFPTLVLGAPWNITRGSLSIASGSLGYTQRTDPTATLYRDRRITTLEQTSADATNLFIVCQNGVQTLQAALAAQLLPPPFLTTTTYDYPPT